MGPVNGMVVMTINGLNRRMKNLYYVFWADSIAGFRNHNPVRGDWKWALFILNTVLNGLNLWIIFSWLKIAGVRVCLLQIPLLHKTMIGSFLGFFIHFVLVFAVLNYFLIFHKQRYEILLQKYSNSEGKIARAYGLATVGFTFVTGIALFVHNVQLK
jgi:hypothetical protein